ncbi:MAG: glycosyltransferase family 9 protein [Bacteroidetes bacterium]|nr:glycosyltransferase family 9 protein [Bacteroidota bacterium]
MSAFFPEAKIDFLLRKGNEGLLQNHPLLDEILIWNKKESKYLNLVKIAWRVKLKGYDIVINLQRFFSTGIITTISGAKIRVCFDKNPLAFFATHTVPHEIAINTNSIHEVERNLKLVAQWTDSQFVKPRIYPSKFDFEQVFFGKRYITISPASVWYTKQFPKEKWLEFMDRVGECTTIFLLGGPADELLCNELKSASKHPKTIVKAGKLSFLESAALMKNAVMNFVNDSAPLHFASATDAPVTAVFCSTIKSFGFWPLSSNSIIVETAEELPCRPCGLHGKKSCPQGHFRCVKIDVERLLERLPD